MLRPQAQLCQRSLRVLGTCSPQPEQACVVPAGFTLTNVRPASAPASVVLRMHAREAVLAFTAALACPSSSRSSAVCFGKSNTLSGPTGGTRAVYSGTERLFQLSASRIEAFRPL